MTKRYEFVFLTRPGLKKKELTELFSALEGEIKKTGGKVEDKEDWGKKELAYPIAKETEASFWVWWLSFEDNVDLSPINTFLNRESKIIRYLFLREGKRR